MKARTLIGHQGERAHKKGAKVLVALGGVARPASSPQRPGAPGEPRCDGSGSAGFDGGDPQKGFATDGPIVLGLQDKADLLQIPI